MNVTIRRTTRAVASRFSVPLSIAMRAPLDTGTHSTGSPFASARSIAASIRSHSAAASEPIPSVGSESTSTRRMPSGTDAVGVSMMPNTIALVFCAGGRPATLTARGESAWGSRSYSSNVPAGSAPSAANSTVPGAPVSMRMIS